MYEIGDRVVVSGSVVGKIVDWHFDEGNVWTVQLPGGHHWDFCESEISPA
jgi:ribosomal protein L16 Arg81 hydroxylase